MESSLPKIETKPARVNPAREIQTEAEPKETLRGASNNELPQNIKVYISVTSDAKSRKLV